VKNVRGKVMRWNKDKIHGNEHKHKHKDSL
jgi:hypothetical protein